MLPASLVMAQRTRKKIRETYSKIYRCTKIGPCRLMTQGALCISMSPYSFRYLRLPSFPSPSPNPSPLPSPSSLPSLYPLHLYPPTPAQFKTGKYTEQFGAHRLLTWKLHDNLSVLGGNGNTLKKRRRKNLKIKNIDRHCTIFIPNKSLLPDLSYFSLYTIVPLISKFWSLNILWVYTCICM
jgi:hypothetical protein